MALTVVGAIAAATGDVVGAGDLVAAGEAVVADVAVAAGGVLAAGKQENLRSHRLDRRRELASNGNHACSGSHSGVSRPCLSLRQSRSEARCFTAASSCTERSAQVGICSRAYIHATWR